MENNASSEGEAKREFRCDPDQYAMLKRCSEKRNMAEWNQWRERNPYVEVWLEGKPMGEAQFQGPLEGAVFQGWYLCGVNLNKAHLAGAHFYEARLQDANLMFASLKGADLRGACLDGASLIAAQMQHADARGAHFRGAQFQGFASWVSRLDKVQLIGADFRKAYAEGVHLEGANLQDADLRGACFRQAAVDGGTLIWGSQAKIDQRTDFTGVGLDSARVAPGLKQSLKDNIRRIGWENWYRTGRWWRNFLKRLFVWPFWFISDHGRSTGRIITVFFALAMYFALAYWTCPQTVMVRGEVGAIRGPLHALYFSVVTMTTLGFGDIHANPESAYGQLLLMVQVILGYVLLGALVTRFAVLFSGEGPAKEFAKKKKIKRATKAQQKEDGSGKDKDIEDSKP